MGKNRSTLWAMEMMLNQDLNGDRFVGEPVPRNEPRAIPISTSKRDGVIEVENGSEITGYSWRSFAVAVMCHRVNISKEKITKATADPAFPYEKVSQPQYLLIYGNLQANRYMSGGNYLTGAGWLYLSRWVPQGHDITLPFPEDAS